MEKKSIKFIWAALAVALLLVNGCKKEDDVSKVVDVSHPTVTLVGDPVVILNVGDTYNDEGATYYDSLYGDNGTISTSTVVNTAEEGFYIVRYTATNQYGFEGSGTRLVAVTGASNALDVSGDYARTSNGAPAVVSKIGRGVFYTDNVSGAPVPVDGAYFMLTGDSTMVMPTQFLPNFATVVDFVNPVYDFTASPPNYSYIIDNPGFAPSVRRFELQ